MRVSDHVMSQLQLVLAEPEFENLKNIVSKKKNKNIPNISVLVATQINACDYYRAYMVAKELSYYEVANIKMVHNFTAMDAYQSDLLLCFRPKDRGLLEFSNNPSVNCSLMADYDDDVFSVPSANFLEPNFGEPDKQTSLAIVERVNQLTVSTRRLQSLLVSRQPKCSVIPNTIDFDGNSKLLQHFPKQGNDNYRIGWAGTFTHTEDLMGGEQPFLKALRRLMRKYRNVEVVFWGICPEGFRHEFTGRVAYKRSVQLFAYMAELAKLNLDLIVYPLINHQFNYSKSNIRWLEASLVHVPVIASDIPSYKEIGEDLCTTVPFTEEHWFQAMEYAYLNQDQMRERAVKSREIVKEQWSIQTMWPAWAAVFEKAIQGDHIIQDFTPPTFLPKEEIDVVEQTEIALDENLVELKSE